MTYLYPRRAFATDFARAGGGLVLTGGPLVGLDLPLVAVAILAPLTVLFAVFGWQALRRFRTRIEASPEGLVVQPGNVHLPWKGLTQFGLGYFSVRRDGREGWMELKLCATDGVLRVDSRLDGFHDLVARAVAAAEARSLPLDPATCSNLNALGMGRPRPPAPAEPAS